MLEEHYRAELGRLLNDLTCEVALPTMWKSTYFGEQGVLQTVPNERRRFARHRFRSQAILEIATSLPAFERTEARYAVLIRDISRNGVGFLHTEQLFPLERCRLWLPTNLVEIHVSRCRKLNASCYLIGGQFVENGEAAAD